MPAADAVMQEQVLSIRAFGPEDGFIGLESLRGASMLDGDSSLWFGTVRGATRYDSQQVVDDTQEPLVHLTDLQLFYERPDWSPWCAGLSRNGFPSELHLPHDKNHLTFSFTGISLAYPEKVRYRWIREGYDPDWSPITATQRVTYSNIPPGDYTFKVMARNASGIWNEKPVTYTFTIAPPFWRTTSFLAGGGLTLLLGFGGFVRLRERNQRRERERLERMVKIRTSQLAEEKERSDDLLRNILPASTAEELKQKGTAEAWRVCGAAALCYGRCPHRAITSTVRRPARSTTRCGRSPDRATTSRLSRPHRQQQNGHAHDPLPLRHLRGPF